MAKRQTIHLLILSSTAFSVLCAAFIYTSIIKDLWVSFVYIKITSYDRRFNLGLWGTEVFAHDTMRIPNEWRHDNIVNPTETGFVNPGTIRICRILVILATVTSFLQIFLSLAWKEIRNGKSMTALGGTVIATSILTVSFIVSTLALIYNEGREEEISFHLGVAAGASGIIACLLIITTFCLNIRPSVESCKVEPFDNS